MSDDVFENEDLTSQASRNELFEEHALMAQVNTLPELQPVVGVSPETTVRDAIKQMVSRRVGCLVITVDGRLTGVFSERDVLTKVALNDIDVDATPVSQLMTPRPEAIPEASELVYALHKMAVGGYRHVPLVDEDGKPTAVVSMRDIVDYIVALDPAEVLNLPDPDHPISHSREGA